MPITSTNLEPNKRYRLAWVNLDTEGVYSGEAANPKEFLAQAIRDGICSLDWSALHVLTDDGWVDTGLI